MDRSPARAAVSALIITTTVLIAGCSGNTRTTTGATNPPAGEQAPASPQPPDDPGTTPGGSPSVSLTASDNVVSTGDSVDLSWNAQNVSECTASGGWSGSRNVSGSATVGPMAEGTTFTLSCTGTAGNAMAMLSVSVLGSVSLAWQPPEENEDGSPVNDLSGYRIHYGTFSRDYDEEVTIANANATQWSMDLPSGEYYFAMTAFDAQGNESSYSNEVQRSVN